MCVREAEAQWVALACAYSWGVKTKLLKNVGLACRMLFHDLSLTRSAALACQKLGGSSEPRAPALSRAHGIRAGQLACCWYSHKAGVGDAERVGGAERGGEAIHRGRYCTRVYTGSPVHPEVHEQNVKRATKARNIPESNNRIMKIMKLHAYFYDLKWHTDVSILSP